MLNISPVKIQNYNYQNSAVATKPVTFKGAEDAFQRTSKVMPEIEVLDGVSKDFVSRITKQIGEFPQKWLTKLKNESYQTVLSPTFIDAYTKKRVFDSDIFAAEFHNPKGTLGVTYADYSGDKNFFVFCDKPPYSDKYMSGVVNHELSHGVVNVLGLDKNAEYLKAIQKDVELIAKNRKLDKLTETERLLVSHYFFNQNASFPIDEIIADCIAWQQKGGGCYGSGLVLDVKNPNLIPNLFPTLSAKVKNL
jgi:hypothetical protein